MASSPVIPPPLERVQASNDGPLQSLPGPGKVGDGVELGRGVVACSGLPDRSAVIKEQLARRHESWIHLRVLSLVFALVLLGAAHWTGLRPLCGVGPVPAMHDAHAVAGGSDCVDDCVGPYGSLYTDRRRTTSRLRGTMTTEPHPDPPFRELLRQHRQAAGLTQEKLAEAAGLSARGISDLERGARNSPHPETVRRLAAALDLDEVARAVFVRAAPRRTGLAAVSPTTVQRAFPLPMTPLIGREMELATIHRWVLEERHRLVTLQGPGGMGKTRLVIAAAEQLAGDFRDGTVFVDLSPVRDPALLVAQIVAALGLQEQPGQALQDTLVVSLHPRHLLLVLDNFEQLLLAAPIVADLLRAAPELHVLITSRAPLRLQGERRFQVPPLGGDPIGVDDLEAARANDAVTLFVTQAQAVHAEFVLTTKNAADVLAICRRLDGLPLALELAAARLSILPLDALRDRLSTALPLLTTGSRDAPTRHQTLREAIAWSEALLDPPVCTFFHRLGVFVGGWTLEAAEAVAAHDGVVEVVDGLAALRDLNLIRVEAHETGPRYTMLETIREFALERLHASPEADAVVHAHAAYFQAFVATVFSRLYSPEQGVWTRRLDAEIPNVRAALQTLARDDDVDAHLRFVANLGDYWYRRMYLAEGRAHLEAALARATQPSLPQAEAMLWGGVLAFGQDDLPAAERWLGRCEALARTLNAAPLLFDALFWHGVVADLGEQDHRALASFKAALTVAQERGYEKGIGSALTALAPIALHGGDLDRAEQWSQEALPYLHAAGDLFDLSVGYAGLGEIALARGDLAQAARAFQASLTHALSSDVAWLYANALVGFAALAARSDITFAAQLLGATETARAESLHLKVPSHVMHMDTTQRVRAALSEPDYLDAWDAGQALTRDELLARLQHRRVEEEGSETPVDPRWPS